MMQQIFGIVFPLFAIVALGYLYARRHAPDMAAANQINLDLFVPALIFHVLSDKSFELQQFGELALAGAVIILGSGLIAWPVARLLGYQTSTLVPPMMFSNSGNMGLPLALFTFGEAALPAAVVLFIVENSLHFSVGVRMMDRTTPLLSLLRVPMVAAAIAGIAVTTLQVGIPPALGTAIEMVAQVSIPLMLFSLGVRLLQINLEEWKIGLLGALLAPLSGLLVYLLLAPWLALSELQLKLLLLFAVLPPAVLNFMVAEQYRQEPERVAAIVMMGNLAALVVIPLTLLSVL
jgi:predicted permease